MENENENKPVEKEVYFDNSPEAMEARKLKIAIKKIEEFKEFQKLRKSANTTEEVIELKELKKAAKKTKQAVADREMQAAADDFTMPSKQNPTFTQKAKNYFKNKWG